MSTSIFMSDFPRSKSEPDEVFEAENANNPNEGCQCCTCGVPPDVQCTCCKCCIHCTGAFTDTRKCDCFSCHCEVPDGSCGCCLHCKSCPHGFGRNRTVEVCCSHNGRTNEAAGNAPNLLRACENCLDHHSLSAHCESCQCCEECYCEGRRTPKEKRSPYASPRVLPRHRIVRVDLTPANEFEDEDDED